MSGFFKNKVILLISPEKWGKMQISKHHYAIELSKRCKTVFFLNPPNAQLAANFHIETHNLYANLKIVTYKPFFSHKLKFHARWLFDILMKVQIKKLLAAIKQDFDIVWCFNSNTYSNLNWFNAKMNIYHPVDQLSHNHQVNVAGSADIVFSVSHDIIDRVSKKHACAYFINHGLSEHFLHYAKTADDHNYKPGNPLKVGYVGNLFIKGIDRKIMTEIIDDNGRAEFHFWGPVTISDSNLSGYDSTEIRIFIDYLEQKKNAILHGVRTPEELSGEIQEMDAFLICVDLKQDFNKGANSHKILEYLSTGKVIISSCISTYADKKGLIEMLNEPSNDRLPELFKNVIKEIDYYNNMEHRIKRIEFAMDNTYSKQIDRIEIYLGEISK